jgi:replicative superfamily II helicase
MKTLEDVEFDKSLENFHTLEDLEFFKIHLVAEIAKIKKELQKLEDESAVIEYEREDLLNELNIDGSIIAYVSKEFRNDYEVMLCAVMHYEWALCYASAELQNDYEIVYQALKKNPNQIEWASSELKNDAAFVKMYIDYWVGEYKIYQTLEEFLEFHPLSLDKETIIENILISV